MRKGLFYDSGFLSSLFQGIRGIEGVCIHCCYVGWNGRRKGELCGVSGDIFERE